MERGAGESPAGRWVGVGRSLALDGRAAAAEAVEQALDGASEPALVMVFCSSLYDLQAVADGVRSSIPDTTRVAGCTSLGEIGPLGPGEGAGASRSVVAIGLGGPDFEVVTRLVRDASHRRREVGAESAGVMAGLTTPHQAFVMLADGLTREHHEIVRGAYAVLGATIPIVGGCSADELAYNATAQFFGTGAEIEIVSDAIVAIGLGSSAPIGVGVAHGWSKRGEPMVVTSSAGGEVFRLDDEPALDVYLRHLGGGRSLLDDPRKFAEAAVTMPLGLSRRDGEDLRVIHDFNEDHGSVLCLADVPQGALAWMMTTDDDALIDAATQSCEMALTGLGGESPRGILLFDCGARRAKLGPEGTFREQARIARHAQGAPFGGFYTYGEIGRMAGSRGMHLLSVVSLALA